METPVPVGIPAVREEAPLLIGRGRPVPDGRGMVLFTGWVGKPPDGRGNGLLVGLPEGMMGVP